MRSIASWWLLLTEYAQIILKNMDYMSVFSTDEEMLQLENRDMTTNIVGFVNLITAPAPAGKKNELLFKFVLSNGNKQIFVLIWGSILINKYYKDILSNRVIDINGGYCRATNLSKFQEENNFVPFEILIKENTEVSFIGYHNMIENAAKNLQNVSFDNIHTAEGLIEIKGYIRTKFALVHNRLMSYGLGAITDGVKKVTVQIKQFVESSLEKGDFVSVTGTVNGQDSLVTIICESMDYIKFDPNTSSLNPEQIQRGGRPVKRVHPKETAL